MIVNYLIKVNPKERNIMEVLHGYPRHIIDDRTYITIYTNSTVSKEAYKEANDRASKFGHPVSLICITK